MSKRLSLGAMLTIATTLLLILGGAAWWYRTSRPEFRFRHGQAAARSGDFDRAEAYAAELEESGESDLSDLLRGEIFFHQRQPERALGFLKRIQSDADKKCRAAILAAQCYIALKNPRTAENALLFVLSENPDQADAHRWLAVIYYDQGDFNHALDHAKEVARLDPNDEKPHFLIGSMYKDMEQADEAVKAFQESLRRNPNGPKATETRLELAEAQVKNFQDAEALKILEGLDSARAFTLKAEALLPLSRVDEMAALLDAALEKYPDNGGLLRLRGERYLADDNPLEAAKLLERALAQDALDPRSHSQLALCYTAMGRTEEAAAHNQKAQETRKLIERVHELAVLAMKDPWDGKTRDELGELCEKLNRPQLAKMWRTAAAACRAAKSAPQ